MDFIVDDILVGDINATLSNSPVLVDGIRGKAMSLNRSRSMGRHEHSPVSTFFMVVPRENLFSNEKLLWLYN